MILTLVRVARRAVGLVGVALFAVLVAFALFTRVAPLTGHQLFIIIGGSMEPTIPIGSLAVVTPVDATTLAVGDVVTIRADNGVVVTHRVSRVVDSAEGRFFEIKGDANASPDGSLVPARAIVGAAAQYVPYAGYAQDFLSKIAGLIAASVGPRHALRRLHAPQDARAGNGRRSGRGAGTGWAVNRVRRVEAITIVGLTVACLGLASNLIVSSSRSANAGDPQRLSVSSIDLTAGTRDARFSALDMAPGDAVTATVTVANPSRDPMSYTMSTGPISAAGAALSAALVLTIKMVGSSCDDNDGTTLYSGPLDQAAFGSPRDGLPLAAATAEILCFRAVLPISAGNEPPGCDHDRHADVRRDRAGAGPMTAEP